MSTSSVGLRPLFPIVTSTATVGFAVAEVLFFSYLLPPPVPPVAIAKWWEKSLGPGLAWVFAIVGGSSISGLLASRSNTYNLSPVTKKLYQYGAAFAVGHFLYGPKIARVIEKMAYGPEDEVKDNQKRWLKIHAVRTFTTDIPALVCYILAFYQDH